MSNSKTSTPSSFMVIVAFATVYIAWGSTYFFIHIAIQAIPPFLLGAIRFTAAGLIMLLWCLYKRERIFVLKQLKMALITGFLLLFVGNGAVIWVEQFLPSALVAILVSAAPIWFVLLDKPKWTQNLTNRATLTGLVIGFGGVILLFYENILSSISAKDSSTQVGALAMLILGSIAWSGGSLYSKYKSEGGSASVNSMWQMLIAGLIFFIVSLLRGETEGFLFNGVSTDVWLSVLYLIFFGSIAGYSAYVWLLEVRPATQVSTYAYVNPVIAVLLGVFFAHESISFLQILGLVVILLSVLLLNLSNYRKAKKAKLLYEDV
jgi:drug/metabolite transporter (DMT)-like permease